ncbi:MAG: DUF421 domain-containing protein [Chloroflexota bacterium]|jgi:uncharacterized membrane protein YcaP (DUF421 family)
MQDFIFGIDWRELFVPQVPLLESIVRMSAVYLFLVGLFRTVLKREAASLSISDLLVVVLMADAVQNAMGGNYNTITDGLILATTLVFWDWFLSYAALRWRGFRNVVRPAPLLLVRDGQPIPTNMRKELLTEEELLSNIRLHGVESFDQVKYAFMEMDGRISVITRNRRRPRGGADKKAAA